MLLPLTDYLSRFGIRLQKVFGWELPPVNNLLQNSNLMVYLLYSIISEW